MRLNIAGAFSKSKEIRLYITLNKHLLEAFDVTVYDGINCCPWNGGRINRDVNYDNDMIEFYYRHNIDIALTFTNPIVDTTNKIGNELLEKFHKRGNIIISVNAELREYVKKHYPLYKHTRSITAFDPISVPMSDMDFDLYKSLEEHYDYIVPRCEHVFDDRFKMLDQSKYEIMLNDTCIYNCPYYGDHFKKIAEQNILYDKPWEEADHSEMYSIEECWISDRSTYKKPEIFNPDIGDDKTINKYGDNYGMDLKTKQIKRLLKQGVTNFKISGREMSFEEFNNELNQYFKDVYYKE
jgi:hypothetical protein